MTTAREQAEQTRRQEEVRRQHESQEGEIRRAEAYRRQTEQLQEIERQRKLAGAERIVAKAESNLAAANSVAAVLQAVIQMQQLRSDSAVRNTDPDPNYEMTRIDWKRYGKGLTGAAYFSPSSITKNGSFRKVLHLMNDPAPSQTGVISVVELFEYNCATSQIRTLSANYHIEPMGLGKPKWQEDTPEEWETFGPESVHANLIRKVCAM